jgi:putative glutamine amidotransferase
MARPLIGIAGFTPACKITTTERYVRAVELAGGLALIIPPQASPERAEAVVKRLDGVLIPGGDDVDPAQYGHARHEWLGVCDSAHDAADRAVIQAALQRRLPLLGICRGLQILNVALGGTLYQDIPAECPSALAHHDPDFAARVHAIAIEPGTLLRDILDANEIPVNSIHHQAIRDLGEGVQVAARAPDGLIEAIAVAHQPFALAVQYHPEALIDSDVYAQRLFAAFIAAAR